MIALPPPDSISPLRSSSTIALSMRRLRSLVPVGIAVVRPEVRSLAEGPASNSRIAAANTASVPLSPTVRGTSCKVLRAPSARTKYTETVARAGRSNHQAASKITATTTATRITLRRAAIGAPVGLTGRASSSSLRHALCPWDDLLPAEFRDAERPRLIHAVSFGPVGQLTQSADVSAEGNCRLAGR